MVLLKSKPIKSGGNYMEQWSMTELQSSIWTHKYNYKKLETSEQWLDRVAGGNRKIRDRIEKKQFSFGGRILSNRGLNKRGLKVTYSNCYVLSPPSDTIYTEGASDDSIWGTAGKMARTYSVGGGVGISLRKIRPRNTAVHNNARTTTGAVSFMPLYSLTTETIGQEGRRGALMLSIPSSHPDLEEFIDVKTQQGAITGANISIEVDDRFMLAVKRNELYRLHFTVEDTGETVEKYVSAKDLYKKLVVNNLDWAEPGMLYWDNIEKYHLMSHHPQFKYVGTNPCAEEPLPAGGSCLLGSVNLSEFVRNPFTPDATFDYAAYVLAIHDAVIALNEVLDEGLDLHPLEEQRRSVRELRQIGLGVMGIADMLIMLGIEYGDDRSLELCDELGDILANTSMQRSAILAKDLGTFDWYDWDYINQSTYFKEIANDETKKLVASYGLRNSQILCIAPTGSLSTMFGISGGIEPFFSLGYFRTTKSLHGKDVKYWVDEPIVEKYRAATGNEGDLPSYFVTAMTLNWRKRIDMQSIWQKYIDASISSTVNLPNDATVEDTMDLYMYAWEKGLKGCTIYRAGCKRGGILELAEETKEETQSEEPTKAGGYYSTCPDCGSEEMWHIDGCVTCKDCGFSPCS
jgi:ribonucleoside-diphosphate reductase alpha chain